MKMTVHLRIAKDLDGKIVIKASTEKKWDALASQANQLFQKPKALPTVRRSVEIDISEKELAGIE